MIEDVRIYRAAQHMHRRLARAGIRCGIGMKADGRWLVFTALLDGGRKAEVRVDFEEFKAAESVRHVADLTAMEVQSILAEDRN